MNRAYLILKCSGRSECGVCYLCEHSEYKGGCVSVNKPMDRACLILVRSGGLGRAVCIFV